jgi:hypothetical protein
MKILGKMLAIFNATEGIIHLVVAIISIWGIIDQGVSDWRVWAAPIENLVFGLFSLLTGYILGKEYLHKQEEVHHGDHH